MLTRTDCRCCRGERLVEVFSLGEQPYANAYLTEHQIKEPEPKCPLVLMECQDCGQVQLSHVVDPETLYSNYAFMTSSSQGMKSHFSEMMQRSVTQYVPANGLVVEIGSNDGTALASLSGKNVRCLGVDPAENLATVAGQRGVPTLVAFFGQDVANEIVNSHHGPADLIVACNVLAHVDDLDEFCQGVNVLLSNEGALIVEVPYLQCLIDRAEFDTIYHEHLSYFAVRPLVALFERNGLHVQHIERHEVHGGTLRLTVRRHAYEPRNVAEWLANESVPPDWSAFRANVEALRMNLIDWLTKMRDAGKVVWGYGAPAKGTVLLNYCGITTDLLPVVVDSTSTKIGKHVPGTHQPILAPCELLNWQPDAALVLAWNHAAEIRRKEADYVARGGWMVVPALNRNKE